MSNSPVVIPTIQNTRHAIQKQIDDKQSQIQPILDEIDRLKKEVAKIDKIFFEDALLHPVELKNVLSKYTRWSSDDWDKIGTWTDIKIVSTWDSPFAFVGRTESDIILTDEQCVLLTHGCAVFDIKIGGWAYQKHITFTSDELKIFAKYGLGVRHGIRRSGN